LEEADRVVAGRDPALRTLQGRGVHRPGEIPRQPELARPDREVEALLDEIGVEVSRAPQVIEHRVALVDLAPPGEPQRAREGGERGESVGPYRGLHGQAVEARRARLRVVAAIQVEVVRPALVRREPEGIAIAQLPRRAEMPPR